jgi:hypothetical protein
LIDDGGATSPHEGVAHRILPSDEVLLDQRAAATNARQQPGERPITERRISETIPATGARRNRVECRVNG